MSNVKRITLDVLKPHSPNALEFDAAIANQGTGYRVKVTVIEVDEKTETARVVVEGGDIKYEHIVGVIADMGEVVHSIRGVAK